MGRIRKQKVTIFSLAQALKLSPSTVSYVLNGRAGQHRISEATAQRVLELAAELDYLPNDLARGLRVKRTGVVGLVVPDLLNSWTHHLLAGMVSVFEPRQYTVHLSVHFWNAHREHRELMSHIQHRVDALALVPLRASNEDYMRILARDVPVVFLADTLEERPEVSHVAWAIEEPVAIAIRHLRQCGRSRIGFLGFETGTVYARLRQQVFAREIEANGLEREEHWTFMRQFDPFETDPLYEEKFVAGLRRMFEAPGRRPDALFCMYDSLALAAVRILRAMNLSIPEDVAVIALGGTAEALNHDIGVTVVEEPLWEMGRQCAEVMLDLIEQPDLAPVQRQVVSEKLTVRRSTALS
jgi:DNA-binding LacI/PurR family transcriptional regulator